MYVIALSWLFPCLLILGSLFAAESIATEHTNGDEDIVGARRGSRGLQQQSKPHAAHRRPLRMGKKNRHNNLRSHELKQNRVDEKKGEGKYKDMLDQDIELEPSFLINDPLAVRLNDSHPPSVLQFDNVTHQNKFSILSMVVEHHTDTRWMIPSYHLRHSAGWNRTMESDQFARVSLLCYVLLLYPLHFICHSHCNQRIHWFLACCVSASVMSRSLLRHWIGGKS